MSKFKIGDRVRCTGFQKDPGNESFIRVGDTGTVVAEFGSFSDASLQVKWDNPNDTINGGIWWVDPNDCELAE